MKSIFGVFLVVLITLSIQVPFAGAEEEAQYVSYSQFISLVETGQIKSVTLDRHSSFKGIQVVSGQERPFHGYGDTGSFNDPLLLRLLKENDVAVRFNKAKEDRGALSWGVGLAFWALPIVLFVQFALVVVINRKVNRLLKQ